MTPLTLAGRRIARPRKSSAAVLGCDALQPQFRFGLEMGTGLPASRGTDCDPLPVDADAGSIIIAHFDDDFRLISRFDRFCEELHSHDRSGGAAAAGLALAALEVFDLNPARSASLDLAHAVEAKLDRAPGLYRLRMTSGFELEREPGKPSTSSPALVFIHGTGSSTRGSFGELASAGALEARYGGQVFGFEHCTLTESPVDNALALARALPEGAELHLITHSRGGLVGELMTLGESNVGDDFPQLRELAALLCAKKIRVTRFVRVACPARGTSLVSGRLEKWLSMILSLAGSWNPLVDALQHFTIAVAHEGLNPATLPGLAAMMPDSPLIRALNSSLRTGSGGLTVVAGVTEAATLAGRLKLLAPALLHAGPNDLVVSTASMDGGLVRSASNGTRVLRFSGPDINHLRYFRNPAVASAIALALLDAPAQAATPLSPALRGGGSVAPAGKRPIVMLLPGIMGSHLKAGGERIWLNYWKLFLGELDRLAINRPHIAPDGVLDGFYGHLIQFLNETHDVVPFGFDWRLSLRTEAARFNVALARYLDFGQPVRVLAHSMGGLLAHAAFALEPQLWSRFVADSRNRFVMLGTPCGGSYEIVRTIAGHAATVKEIALLDARHDLNEVLDLITPYPGLLEMLPRAQKDFDFLNPDDWSRFPDQKAVRRFAHLLSEVRVTRQLLDATPYDPAHTVYVAGYGDSTPVEMRFGPDGRVTFFANGQGDSKVPWASGIPAGITPYFVDAAHADLPNHKPAFPVSRIAGKWRHGEASPHRAGAFHA